MSLEGKQILLVDRTGDAESEAAELRALGLKVSVAIDPDAALLLARRDEFDMAMIDVGTRGADGSDVLRLVLRRALLISAAGLLTGVAAAFTLSRAVSALLYDVPAHDLATYVAVVVVMTVVLLFAAYIPARRALRIEAIAALRAE